MSEKKLLSALVANRTAWNMLSPTLDKSMLTDTSKIIYEEICIFYNLDSDAISIDKDIIKERVAKKYHKHHEKINAIIDNLDVRVSVPNILEEYKQVELAAIGNDLTTLFVSDEHNEKTFQLVEKYLKRARSDAGSDSDVYFGARAEELLEAFKPESLIQVFPSVINATLGGGVPLGSHIVLFARPEIGKSLFSVNMCGEFLKQGAKVLYFGNEDPQQAMRMRFISKLSGLPKDQIIKNPKQAWDTAEDNGLSNLIFVGKGDVSLGLVENLAEKYTPKIIVVDQMRNVNIGNRFTRVEGLEHIAMNLRRIYKDANSIGVSITQAGDSAEGKKILTMGDVDFSNTGIPATADIMLGMGADETSIAMNRRVITFVKNKISGNHDSVVVRVLPNLSTVLDV